jgi:pimeloyl-ACP methyl ester carboxylesterase
VVAGELDERTPLPAVRELAELIPDARLIVVPGAGHLAHLDRPDVVAAEIGDFLDGYMV